jgi:hypothetical protein
MDLYETEWEEVDSFLASDRVTWPVLVKCWTLSFLEREEFIWLAKQLLSSEELPFPTELDN